MAYEYVNSFLLVLINMYLTENTDMLVAVINIIYKKNGARL